MRKLQIFSLGLVALGGPLFIGVGLSAAPFEIPKMTVLALAALLALAVSHRSDLLDVPMDYAVCWWLFASVVCCHYSIDKPVSIFGQYQSQFYELLPSVILAGIYYGVSRSSLNDASKWFVSMLAFAGAAMGLYGMVQLWWGEPFTSFAGHQGGRINSSMGSPIYAGSVLALAAIASLHATFSGNKRFGLEALALTLMGLFLTYSRGAWLAAAAGAAVYCVARWKIRVPRLYLLSVVLGCSLVALAASPRLFTSNKDVARLEMLRVAGSTFVEHPFVGSGQGTYLLELRRKKSPIFIALHGTTRVLQFTAHNEIAQIAGTMGLMGLLAYFLIVFAGIRSVRDSLEEAPFRALGCALLAVHAVQGQVNPIPLASSAIMAALVGLSVRLKIIPHEVKGPRRAAMAFASIALLVCGTLWTADYHYLQGILAHRKAQTILNDDAQYHYRQAAKVNPWEMRYAVKESQAVNTAAATFRANDRVEKVEAALKRMQFLLAVHPNDAMAYQIASKTASLGASTFGGDKYEFQTVGLAEKASELAPMFLGTAINRLQVARIVQNWPGERRAASHINMLRALSAGGQFGRDYEK